MTQYSNDDVIAIAKSQRVIIWLVLASFVDFVFRPVFIIIAFFKFVFVYCLADELKLHANWAFFVCMLIPFVNIILLLNLNAKATAVIRSKGIKVGLMGANKAQLVKLAESI